MLDPNVRLLLDEIAASGDPPLNSFTPADARTYVLANLGAPAGTPEPVAWVENLRVPVPIRIYTPDQQGLLPGIVYFHGGGWVVCNLDTHHVICTALANRGGAVVISVDYRLAPEHKFPAAVDDAYSVTQWVAENAERLGIDAKRLTVCGDSAGGNLATVVAMKARDEAGPRIALQVLVYPVTDLSRFDTPSYDEFADGYHLTKASMEWFRNHYFRSAEDGLDPHASPLLAKDLKGLPPALVITAECDVLRDEGEAYARRLEDAGVPVTLTRYEGMIHPFFSLSGRISQALTAFQQIADAVRALPE